MLKEYIKTNDNEINDYINKNAEIIDKKTVEFLNTLGTSFENLSQTEIQEIRRLIVLKDYFNNEIKLSARIVEEWENRLGELKKMPVEAQSDLDDAINHARNQGYKESDRIRYYASLVNEVEEKLNKYKIIDNASLESVTEKNM